MRLETLRRVIKFGFQNYIRNGWLSLAATLVLALTLFTASVFLLQSYVIKSETRSLRDKLDMAIYINDTPSEEEVNKFIATIKNYHEVKEAQYLNKQAVIEQWNQTQANQKIRDLVTTENNPLPRTVKVKANDPTELETIANRITDDPFAVNLRKVSYQDNRIVIQQLAARAKKITKNGVILSSLFTIIAIIFVYNTIRLIIRMRQDEITIMKLVGATDAFVQGPFLVEGSLYGIIAGLITLPALYLFLRNGLQEGGNLIATSNAILTNELIGFFVSTLPLIALGIIGVAVIVATSCSWISVRHHLKQ